MFAKSLILLITILFRSYDNSNSCDEYFSTVPVEEIKELSLQNILFKPNYIAWDYRGLGTYDEPQITHNMTYDSKSDFSVLVWGYVSVSDTDHAANTQIVDSVAISHFIVLRKNHKAERYSKTPSGNNIDKPWKDCPVPKAIRDKIREDFLTRMKYRTYHIKTDLRKPPVYYGYSLKNDLRKEPGRCGIITCFCRKQVFAQ